MMGAGAGGGGISPEVLEALRAIYEGMAESAGADEAKSADARKLELRQKYGTLEGPDASAPPPGGEGEAPAPDVEDVPGAVGDDAMKPPEEAPAEDAMAGELPPEVLEALLARMK